jgi:hypothetical protein
MSASDSPGSASEAVGGVSGGASSQATRAGSTPAGGGVPVRSGAVGGSGEEVTRGQLDRWASMYGVEHRQLRRWIARGREKGEPCPLDDPAAMPVWIEKHLEKVRSTMRDRVNAAAEAARRGASLPAGDGKAVVVPAQAPAGTVAPLDLG